MIVQVRPNRSHDSVVPRVVEPSRPAQMAREASLVDEGAKVACVREGVCQSVRNLAAWMAVVRLDGVTRNPTWAKLASQHKGVALTNANGWVNRNLYPFRSHWLEVVGGRMHYVDEGTGPVVVMVHGTPTWSFLYRELIRELSKSYRVIAPDQIGFGLSDKPAGWSYRPEDHARNVSTLIERLELSDIALVVHDFGGPIGLSYALEHPDNVRALVLFNTWMWSLEGTAAEKASRFMGGPIGRFLYRRMNLSPRVLVRAAFGDKRKLTREVHRHYIEAFPSPERRQAPWGTGPRADRLDRVVRGSLAAAGAAGRQAGAPALGDEGPDVRSGCTRAVEGGVGERARCRVPGCGALRPGGGPGPAGARDRCVPGDRGRVLIGNGTESPAVLAGPGR